MSLVGGGGVKQALCFAQQPQMRLRRDDIEKGTLRDRGVQRQDHDGGVGHGSSLITE